jgi:hypothetical protein
MTSDEARRRLEASTRFEVRAGLVWLRDPRAWRAAAEPARDARADPGVPARGDAGGSKGGARRRTEAATGVDAA